MWRLAKESSDLDANSPYFYVPWCRDFANTSVTAKRDEQICGFIAGFERPRDPDTLFVWQAAVARAERGNGLAKQMLEHLIGNRYRFAEATVTPDNIASDRFLTGFAKQRGADLTRTPLLSSDLFPAGHAPETLYRIGPLNTASQRKTQWHDSVSLRPAH